MRRWLSILSRSGPLGLRLVDCPCCYSEWTDTHALLLFSVDYTEVLDALQQKGIAIRVASPKLVMEEAPESYKDVSAVVDTCHEAGISNKCVKLRPIAVIKG